MVLLHVLGLTRVGSASTALSTQLGGISRVSGIQPQHVDRMVVPERHDQDVAACKRSAHLVESTERLEGVGVAESRLLRGAEGLGDGVAGYALDGRVAVLEDLAVLYVEALDLREGGARADELGDDGHFLGGVEGGAGAVEVLDAHAVALLGLLVCGLSWVGGCSAYVEITSVLVADTAVTVAAVSARDIISALLKTRALARVRGVGGRDGVGLPDIHLGAAGTDLTRSGVRVSVRWVPALDVGLSVDKLDVVGTLAIAVTSSELGTSLVVALANATVRGHLDEIESTVETARKLGDIDVEGELLADEVEHLVLGVALHEVCTRTNVGRAGALGDELDAQGVAASSDTVGAC
jgi:hypothetical protein